jgi:putative hemolysin
MIALELSIVCVLILLNGFLSMSELALVSARRSLLERMARQGSNGARVALELVRQPGRMLSAVQIGITLVGVVAGAFSGATIAGRFDGFLQSHDVPARFAEPVAFVLVLFAITYLSVIAGELVPKRLALRNAEAVSAAVARPMQLFAAVLNPIVSLLDFSARAGLRLFGGKQDDERSVTDEEIKALIAEAERTGVVEPEEHSMIGRVMRLADRPVGAVMTPRTALEWLDMSASPEAIRASIRRATHSRVLAANGGVDEVFGVVSVKKALVALLDGRDDMRTLVEPVPAVSEHLSALEVVDRLRQSPMKLVLVVDEIGSVEGIVTDGDILRTVISDLANDEETPRAIRRPDGSILIDGAFPVDELADLLSISLPEDAIYHTAAGLALDRLRRVPQIGEAFGFGGWRFEIIDLDGRRIDKLQVVPLVGLHRGV